MSYPPPTLIVEIPTEVVNTVRDLRAENASLRAALTTMRDKHTAWSREDLCVMYEQAIDERESLRRENVALKAALDAQMQYQRDLRADRDRLDWLECLNQLPIRNKGQWVGWDNETYSSLRKTIDAARNHHVVCEKEAQP